MLRTGWLCWLRVDDVDLVANASPCSDWQDANQGSYAFNCFFRTDYVWNLVAESGHVSGRLQPGVNVYVADLSQSLPQGMPVLGLRVNDVRAIRARYPNANPETQVRAGAVSETLHLTSCRRPAGWTAVHVLRQGFGSTLTAPSWMPSKLPKNPDVEVWLRSCSVAALSQTNCHSDKIRTVFGR